LQPVADATTKSNQPAANFGADVELGFGKDGTITPSGIWYLRGHIQFDLTPVLGLGVPQRARLFWYQSRSTAAGCLDVTLHRVTAPWSESAITWSNQPAHDATVSARTCVGDSFSLGWKQFDVTALAQGWLNGTWPNFGMVIRDPSETAAGAWRPGFGHSRESASMLLRPYLEFDFGSSFGSGCATLGSPPVAAFAGGAPHTGGTFLVRTQTLVPGSLPGAAFGNSNTQWGSTPLPLNLGVYGFPGCSLLVAPTAVATFPPLAQSTFDMNLSVPNNTALAGLAVYLQTVAFGPAGSFHLSNGLGVRIY
jgi:hypothetical protein